MDTKSPLLYMKWTRSLLPMLTKTPARLMDTKSPTQIHSMDRKACNGHKVPEPDGHKVPEQISVHWTASPDTMPTAKKPMTTHDSISWARGDAKPRTQFRTVSPAHHNPEDIDNKNLGYRNPSNSCDPNILLIDLSNE